MFNEKDFGLPNSLIEDVKKTLSSSEQIDEISKELLQRYSQKASKEINDTMADPKARSERIDKKMNNRLKGRTQASRRILGHKPKPKDNFTIESLELNILEKLSPSMGVKAYIDDFQKSDNPRFAGKSSEQRRKQAIAAFYSDKKQVKENTEMSKISVGSIVEINNRVYEITGIDNKGMVLETDQGEEFVYDSKTLSEYVSLGYAKILDEQQIDEISKKTLGSYVKKASKDAINKGVVHGLNVHAQSKEGRDFGKKAKEKADKRVEYIGKATDRLTKEDTNYEFVNITEIFEPTMIDIGDIFEAEGETFVVVDMIGEEVRLMNESEELLEISKDTLKSYIHKASSDVASRAMKAGRKHKSDEKIGSRVSGISKAADKLTKRGKYNRTGHWSNDAYEKRALEKKKVNEDEEFETVSYFKRIDE